MDILYKFMFSIAGVAIFSILIHIVFHVIFHKAFYSRIAAKIIGFLVAVFGTYLCITYYNELREIPATPEQLSMDEIPAQMSKRDHLWVSISDTKWDCDNLGHNETDTFAVLLNKDETLVIVANFDKKITCEELVEIRPSGRLDEFVEREFIYTSNFINFAKYEHATSTLSLCTYCGRRNSQLGVVMGAIFTLLGLFFDRIIPFKLSDLIDTTKLPKQWRD